MPETTGAGPRKPPKGGRTNLVPRPARASLLVFAVSLGIQGFFLSRIPPERIRPHTRWEVRSIAFSLVEEGSFSDPYMIPTGPTAHLPPVPPFLTAVAYRLFGVGLAGGYADWLFTAAIYAAAWGILPWLSGAMGLGIAPGLMAGLVGALVPRWSAHGEGLTALALGLLMVAFVRRWMSGTRSPGRSLLLGLAAGVAFHVKPALLPVVLGWLAFEVWWSRSGGRWLHPTLVTVGMILACLPWGWRNYRTFDAVFFIRSNFGLELRMGNHPEARAAMDVMDLQGEFLHPRTHEGEARKVQEMGEIAYMREAGREATDWIRSNPGEFAGLTFSRATHWWLGPLYYPPGALLVSALTVLALWGGWVSFPKLAPPQRAGLSLPLLTFPLVYYLVAYMPRYREPVDGLYLLLAAAAVLSFGGRRFPASGQRRSPNDRPGNQRPPISEAELSSS